MLGLTIPAVTRPQVGKTAKRPQASKLLARPMLRRLAHHIRGLVKQFTYQVAGLPIAVRGTLVRRGSRPDLVIRRAYARLFWHPKRLVDAITLVLAVLFWPAAVVALGIAFIARNGAIVARQSNRAVPMQFLDQIRLYLTAGVLPPWYYIFEFHRHPAKGYARNFIYRWESKGGVMALLREGKRKPVSIVNDKVACAEHCQRHGIPAVPVLAVFRHGSAEIRASSEALEGDLFVKPVEGRGGRGAERWDWVEPSRFRDQHGETLSRDELVARLVRRSAAAPLLVQPRVRNHPRLDTVSNGALATVRVLTCLDEQSRPELIAAAFRMAVGDNHVVDNFHAGGIAAAVDLQTGILGPGSNLGTDCRLGWVHCHPDSDAPITGLQLPWWPELGELAVAAHHAFADRVLIGWDIAIAPDGPLVVEANGSPDLDIMQRVVRHGMMAARLGVLLAFHLSELSLENFTRIVSP